MISLYFHIPFCTKKCPYCHFFVIPDKTSQHAFFLEALKKEWNLVKSHIEGKEVVSIYFGGGTPSLLGAAAIAQILSWIPFRPGIEITLEANPEHISLQKMEEFRAAGINRVSLGLQSLDNSLLKTLGRSHSAEQGILATHQTAQAGIQNISVDLMYEIPGQTLSAWESTLDTIRQLPITHLSLYNLTFEPGALFYKKQKEFSPLLPSPEVSFHMLEMACLALENMGLERYEISAFAKPSFKSQHNIGYWIGRPFLGLGPSAFSYWNGHRFRNICHLNKYIKILNEGQLPRDFDEKLPPLASLHERLAIYLRLFEGAPLQDFPIDSEILKSLESKSWISLSSDRIVLTEQGRLFYDSVAEEIILT